MRQIISVEPSNLNVLPNGELDFDVIYSTADPVDETLTGLGLRLHFNSDTLTFNEASNVLGDDLFGSVSVADDTEDFDDNPDTDKFVLASWASFTGQWPGEGDTPATLYTANFTATEDFDATGINFTASSTAAGYELDADSVRIAKTDRPPVVANAIADLTVLEDSAVRTIDLSEVFSDPDDVNAVITEAIQANSNPGLVTAAIDGDNLTLTFAENQSGVADITLRATSGGKTVSDTFRVNVTSVDDPLVESSGIFTTDEMSNYLFQLLDSSSDTGSVNEVGIYTVDDTSGTIDDISPEDDSYLEAVLERSQELFSVLANLPAEFAGNIESILGLEADTNFGFYLLPNSTTEMAQTKLAAGEDIEIFLSTSENLTIEESAETPGLFNLNWEESALGNDNPGDFDDLSLSVQATDREASLVKNIDNPEIIDLRNAAPTSSVGENNIDYTVTLTREADFDSNVALYEIQDFDGTIVDPVSGETIAATAANQAEYIAAAKALAVNPLRVGDEEIETSDSMQIEVGKLYAPILLMDVENFEEVYTPYMAVNTQGMDRVRSLGDNIIGFEDNIDNDYNDLVAQFEFL
jgi:hypothetical protein